MTKKTESFSPPTPDSRVSELLPDRLQEWASIAGRKILDNVEVPDLMTPEQVQGSYNELKKAIAQQIVEDDEFVPETTTPFRFERTTPTEINEHGEEVPKKTWHFTSTQYLQNLSEGVYPISVHRGNTMYHDALHAAELSVLQKYCPAVSQLMIGVAKTVLNDTPERQHIVTEIIDYFTDAFSLDDLSAGIFEWRASDLYRIAQPGLSPDEAQKKAKALTLEAVSGLTRYMTEHAASQAPDL